MWEAHAFVYLWGLDIETNDVYKTGLEIVKANIAADFEYGYRRGTYDSSHLDQYIYMQDIE